MTIKIRTRSAKNGTKALFLDIYNPNSLKTRTSKTLNLFVYDNPTASQKKSNKEALEAAERIRSKMTIDSAYTSNSLGSLSNSEKSNINFLNYFKQEAEKRYDSQNNYGNWMGTYQHLHRFAPEGIPILQVDAVWLEKLKYYLQHEAKTKSNVALSQNTIGSYYNKVRACLGQAFREEIIYKNPALLVKGFKVGEVAREFVTFEELQLAAKAECEIPQLKVAFLFSALTGIRWSDINNLTWNDLQYSESIKHWFVRFRQQKTKGVETLPISDQARGLLGETGDKNERIFKGLKYSAWHNMRLQQWIMKAGIAKTITFHCARHTYATLQLTNGTDIYTVSKLLGHRELKTTQVYAKIIDEKKLEASKAIPNLIL
ncbi:MAG TPA: site-specific integrase [Flavobacterium sp.]